MWYNMCVHGLVSIAKYSLLRMKIMRRMLRLRMLLKKNLLTLRILKNWKNFDDRCVIFLCVLYFTTLY